MDIDADLYFTLDPSDAEALIRSGVRPVSAPKVNRSILDRGRAQAPLSPRIVYKVWTLLLEAKRTIAAARVAEALRSSVQKNGDGAVERQDVEKLATLFVRVRKVIPMAPHCLTDCLALIGWLRLQGAVCSLVFGVKLDPFAAHCWVQAGEVLLSDRCEAIERFTPVGTIECGPATR